MESNPVGWFEIYVSDMKRATAFYEAVLAIKLDELPAPVGDLEMMAFPMSMERYGAPGALAKMKGVEPGGNSTIVYFSCDDCATEAGRVKQAGGRLEQPKFAIGEHGFIAMAVDTEGNMIGLHSMA